MIESNITPNELDSPFYKRNEAICKQFEELILEMGGKTIGSYNSWSYNVKGKIDGEYLWIFQIKKATYTSGNLLLSSAHQNLLVNSYWKCKNLDSNLPDFLVRKRKAFDFVRLIVNSKLKTFKHYKNVLITSSLIDHPIVDQLYDLLEGLFRSKKVNQISYVNNELIVELRTSSIHANYIRALVDLKFDT